MTEKCPRCGWREFTPRGERWDGTGPPYPALSRVADIDICTWCGTDEAMRDMAGRAPVPPDEWPMPEYLFREMNR